MDYDIGVSKVSKYFKFKRQRYRTWLTALELWKHFINGHTLISIINYLSISIYSVLFDHFTTALYYHTNTIFTLYSICQMSYNDFVSDYGLNLKRARVRKL